MRARWNPWKALRSAGPTVELAYAELPDGVDGLSYPLAADRAGVELDHGLGRVERNATLGHELIHVEWRLWFPPGTPPLIVTKGEERVDRELIRRLVPMPELALFVAMRAEFGAVNATMVADEFEVPHGLAHRACWLLSQQYGVLY